MQVRVYCVSDDALAIVLIDEQSLERARFAKSQCRFQCQPECINVRKTAQSASVNQYAFYTTVTIAHTVTSHVAQSCYSVIGRAGLSIVTVVPWEPPPRQGAPINCQFLPRCV